METTTSNSSTTSDTPDASETPTFSNDDCKYIDVAVRERLSGELPPNRSLFSLKTQLRRELAAYFDIPTIEMSRIITPYIDRHKHFLDLLNLTLEQLEIVSDYLDEHFDFLDLDTSNIMSCSDRFSDFLDDHMTYMAIATSIDRSAHGLSVIRKAFTTFFLEVYIRRPRPVKPDIPPIPSYIPF